MSPKTIAYILITPMIIVATTAIAYAVFLDPKAFVLGMGWIIILGMFICGCVILDATRK